MPFRYACFVSYRHGQQPALKDLVRRFHDSLAGELELWLGPDLPVYVDEERLKAGHLYNEALAADLCKSVCMIMLFTPTYFDRVHRYCAREYHGMLTLERQRLALLDPEQRQYGLIIPIVFRGESFLPAEIVDRRNHRNFENYTLESRDPSRRGDYRKEIKKVAEYIMGRHAAMDPFSDEICKECDRFSLPRGEDLDDWFTQLSGPSGPFSVRRRQR